MPSARCRAILPLLASGLVLLAPASQRRALDPAYLQHWPAPEQVLSDHQGSNPQDTLARQMAALHHLDRSLEDMAGARRWHGLTPDENQLRGRYGAAVARIRTEVSDTLSNQLPPGFHGPFAQPPLQKWYSLQWQYERDPDVRQHMLAAEIVIATFRGEDLEATAELRRLAQAALPKVHDLPVTRLHPDGPQSTGGHRLLGHLFTARLVRLARAAP